MSAIPNICPVHSPVSNELLTQHSASGCGCVLGSLLSERCLFGARGV